MKIKLFSFILVFLFFFQLNLRADSTIPDQEKSESYYLEAGFGLAAPKPFFQDWKKSIIMQTLGHSLQFIKFSNLQLYYHFPVSDQILFGIGTKFYIDNLFYPYLIDNVFKKNLNFDIFGRNLDFNIKKFFKNGYKGFFLNFGLGASLFKISNEGFSSFYGAGGEAGIGYASKREHYTVLYGANLSYFYFSKKEFHVDNPDDYKLFISLYGGLLW
ncbi:MAG TPA: hypothetical protein DHW82_06460 [Spirochaetia bacterium]|nr:MAG: hypothetical protein A2Y41_09430 [Spirochaetes bacterium GWB1_36_13]HCL56635.1 hypothetical protein [Spirochaetia bacterium]